MSLVIELMAKLLDEYRETDASVSRRAQWWECEAQQLIDIAVRDGRISERVVARVSIDLDRRRVVLKTVRADDNDGDVEVYIGDDGVVRPIAIRDPRFEFWI